MKKRVLCAILFVVMLLSVMTVSSFAKQESYDVWVNGMQFTSNNINKMKLGQSGDSNYAKYDPETNTITLVNATISTISKDTAGIVSRVKNKKLTIILEGASTIKCGDAGIYVSNKDKDAFYDLEIKAGEEGASLTIFAGGHYGIRAKNVKIDANVKVSSSRAALCSSTQSLTLGEGYKLNASTITDDTFAKATTELSSLVFDSGKELIMSSTNRASVMTFVVEKAGLGVWVNGEEFTSKNATTGITCGNGKATLDTTNPDKWVLTLTNAEITKTFKDGGYESGIQISSSKPGDKFGAKSVEIVVASTSSVNVVSSSDNGAVVNGIVSYVPFKISGSRVLNVASRLKTGVSGKAFGIHAIGALTIDAEININSETPLLGYSGVTIDSSKYRIDGSTAPFAELKNCVFAEIVAPPQGMQTINLVTSGDFAKTVYIKKCVGVWVNGEPFTEYTKEIKCGAGKATLDTSGETWILTLNGATIDKGKMTHDGDSEFFYDEFYSVYIWPNDNSVESVKLVLVGDNIITTPATPGDDVVFVAAIYTNPSLEVTGEGKLKVLVPKYSEDHPRFGVYGHDGLTIEADVYLSTLYDWYGFGALNIDETAYRIDVGSGYNAGVSDLKPGFLYYDEDADRYMILSKEPGVGLGTTKISKIYNITYELNVADDSASKTVVNTNPATYTNIDEITLVAPTRLGYTFTGWYSDAELTTPVTKIVRGTEGNKTFYAKWEVIVYNITYVDNVESWSVSPASHNNVATYTVEDAVVLADAERRGYTFNGWCSNEALTNAVTGFAAGTTGDKTFYADWSINNYNIRYILAGGKNAKGNPTTYTVEDSIIYLIPASKAYNSFRGWYDDETRALKPFIPAHSIGDVTVMASWTESTLLADIPTGLGVMDVTMADWSYSNIALVLSKGYMDPTSATTFSPKASTKRAEVVYALWMMEGAPVVNYAMSFKDIEIGSKYLEAIRWAASEKITLGMSETEFAPNETVTREQFATFLYRYAQKKGAAAESAELTFSDKANISDWAVEAVKWCVKKGIIIGRNDGTFDSQALCKREEAAAMISRFASELNK